MNKEQRIQPEGCALVDKEAAGADVPLGGRERGVLRQLLLQRLEHCLLQLADLLQVSQSVSIWTQVFAQ